MKKIFAVLLIMFLFAFGLCFKNSLFSFCEEEVISINSGSVEYAGANLGFLCEKVSEDYVTYEQNGEVVGECVFVKKSALEKIASDIGLVVLEKYEVAGRTVVEGVSALLKFSIEGRQANVQICIDGEVAQIASPIIYGSF